MWDDLREFSFFFGLGLENGHVPPLCSGGVSNSSSIVVVVVVGVIAVVVVS